MKKYLGDSVYAEKENGMLRLTTNNGLGDSNVIYLESEVMHAMMDFIEKACKGEKMEQEPMLQFFKYDHLPAHLQAVSKPFGDLAVKMLQELPSNAERTAGLRKLLEAKDCAVRAIIYK